MAWSAQQYVKFEDERTRPVRDLIARLPQVGASHAVDLGCGPGNSTELLRDRFPDAIVTGVDNSPEMIAAARARLPQTRFGLHDIATWSETAEPVDVILANAAFQWVPDHAVLLPGLLGRLRPGGSLAVQMPDNLHEPAHVAMRAVAADSRWADRLAAAARPVDGQHDAGWYFDVLSEAGARVDIWRTIYHHRMAEVGGIVEWFKGSSLRPFLTALDEAEQQAFVAAYQAAITPAYPRRSDGSVLLPFPRLFFVATMP